MGHPLKYKPVIANHVLTLQKPFSFKVYFYLFYLYRVFNQNICTWSTIQISNFFSHTLNSCINTPNQIDVAKQNNRLPYIFIIVTILSKDTLTCQLFITKNLYKCIQVLKYSYLYTVTVCSDIYILIVEICLHALMEMKS